MTRALSMMMCVSRTCPRPRASEPGTLKTEAQYEKSLYDFLHDNLESIQVTKQYARGRIRADIVVNDDVIVEMKNNLDTTGKMQRLVGQLETYKKWDGSIIVLVCGTIESNLRKELKGVIKAINDDSMDGLRASLIEKD